MKNWQVIVSGIAGACAFAGGASLTHAEIFRCTTAEGKTLYSDSPCPRDARAVIISTRLGVCVSDACRADQEERAAAALARLRAEQQALATLTEQRRQAEVHALEERIRLEELRRLAAMNQNFAADAQFSDQYAAYYPVYPWYPLIALPCVNCIHPRPLLVHRSHPPGERPASFVRARAKPFALEGDGHAWGGGRPKHNAVRGSGHRASQR